MQWLYKNFPTYDTSSQLAAGLLPGRFSPSNPVTFGSMVQNKWQMTVIFTNFPNLRRQFQITTFSIFLCHYCHKTKKQIIGYRRKFMNFPKNSHFQWQVSPVLFVIHDKNFCHFFEEGRACTPLFLLLFATWNTKSWQLDNYSEKGLGFKLKTTQKDMTYRNATQGQSQFKLNHAFNNNQGGRTGGTS